MLSFNLAVHLVICFDGELLPSCLVPGAYVARPNDGI